MSPKAELFTFQHKDMIGLAAGVEDTCNGTDHPLDTNDGDVLRQSNITVGLCTKVTTENSVQSYSAVPVQA